MIFVWLADAALWLVGFVVSAVDSNAGALDSIDLPASGLTLLVPVPGFVLDTSIEAVVSVSLLVGAVLMFARLAVWLYEHLPFIN